MGTQTELEIGEKRKPGEDLATPNQLWRLNKEGVKHKANLSFGEASGLLDEALNK